MSLEKIKKEQIAGSRIEIAKYKRNPEDFVLWKPSKNDEPAWSSPWEKEDQGGTLNAV